MKTVFNLAILLLTSSFLAAQDNCNLPSITSTSGSGIYCLGDQVQLSVEGDLGDATQWEWSVGSCGQNIFENAFGNLVTISVTASISYFVRAVGGCVPAGGECEEIKIVLDDEPPTPICSEDILVNISEGETSAAVEYDIPGATDNCPGGVKIELEEGIKSGGIFPLGATTVGYRFTDARGNSTTCSFEVTVKEKEDPTDPSGPMITCSEDITVTADPGKCGATVNYKVPESSGNSTVELTAGLGSGAFFPVGTTTETYTATDGSGNTMSCSFRVNVTQEISNEPPTITLSSTSLTIWPPDHRKVKVDISDYVESANGSCETNGGQVVITKVTSDEKLNGIGDGNTSDDIVIANDCQSVELRAERSGFGNGRVYTIYLATSDANGNIAHATIKAEVPHDKGSNKDGRKEDYHSGQHNGDKKDGDRGKENNKDDDDDRDKDDDDRNDRDKHKDDDDHDDRDKHKDGRSQNYGIDDGPAYTVMGCEPSTPPPPEAPPVYYSYLDEDDQGFATSINPYPNPFLNFLKVKYTASNNDEVSLVLYDLNGVRAAELYRGKLNSGQRYNWNFDLQPIENKIYLLVLRGSNTYETRKVVKY